MTISFFLQSPFSQKYIILINKKHFFAYILFSLISCNINEKSNFLTIPINPYEEVSLSLSNITNNIEAIELELTDESLIGKVSQVCYSGDSIFILANGKIMLFDKTGKFIKQIGSRGQGPGEYLKPWNIATDNKNRKLYVNDVSHIICYDFDGNYIKKSVPSSNQGINYLCHVNNQLLLYSRKIVTSKINNTQQISLYFIDENLSNIDSIEIYKRELSNNRVFNDIFKDFITTDGSNIYIYHSDISPNAPIIDTLYQLKNRQLIPYLNVSFKNKGKNITGEKNIDILNIYKNIRYVFVLYQGNSSVSDIPFSCFCYDTKDKVAYNMEDGFLDDIHTGQKVIIRPLGSDTNKFYFLYTNIDDSDKEEPNPTLYIATLKNITD